MKVENRAAARENRKIKLENSKRLKTAKKRS